MLVIDIDLANHAYDNVQAGFKKGVGIEQQLRRREKSSQQLIAGVNPDDGEDSHSRSQSDDQSLQYVQQMSYSSTSERAVRFKKKRFAFSIIDESTDSQKEEIVSNNRDEQEEDRKSDTISDYY